MRWAVDVLLVKQVKTAQWLETHSITSVTAGSLTNCFTEGWGRQESLEVTWSNLSAPAGLPKAGCLGLGCTDNAWGNLAEELFENEKRINQILPKACVAIKQSKVKGLAGEVQLLRIKRQDGHNASMDVSNKISAMLPSTKKHKLMCFGFSENAYSGLQPDYEPFLSSDLEELFQQWLWVVTSLWNDHRSFVL